MCAYPSTAASPSLSIPILIEPSESRWDIKVMTDRRPQPRFPSLFLTGWALLSGALLCTGVNRAAAARQEFTFDDGQITCTVSTPDTTEIPDRMLAAVPLAMKTAIQEIGRANGPAHLTILLQGSPTTFERLKGLFQPDIFAIQEGDEIRLRAPEDPLALSFRLAHETSHWLVARQYPARPPLWLDEGLAQVVGATAAAAAARTQSQQLLRPIPNELETSAYTLEELTALTTYPRRKQQIAAFYWQAEALTRALRKRLGKEAFADYLALLSNPTPPDWQAPLITRWYFNEGDIAWLARQITPGGNDTP
jgi:hypothetical protein